MENKNLEKKEKANIWKIILKIIFILICLWMIWIGWFMAVCWWIFLFDSWGWPMNFIYFIIPWIILFVWWIIFIKKIINKK